VRLLQKRISDLFSPGFGLHPKFYKEVLGKKVKRNIEKGERLSLEDLE
jgi:pseudaminic acid synthase